jgi:hypothetical protein
MDNLIEYPGVKRGPGGRSEKTKELNDAVEDFAFNRLPRYKKIALVLAGIFGGPVEQYYKAAKELGFYVDLDFAIPYKPPVTAIDVTMEDILR